MSNMNQEGGVLHDAYGSYTSSPPLPPVPPFPCVLDSLCTADNRLCNQHKSVLFVKSVTTNDTFEIPYGKWENWLWYKQRVSDRTGIPVDEIRLIYAGADRDNLTRHSGLASQSTVHMVLRSPIHQAVPIDKKT